MVGWGVRTVVGTMVGWRERMMTGSLGRGERINLDATLLKVVGEV